MKARHAIIIFLLFLISWSALSSAAEATNAELITGAYRSDKQFFKDGRNPGYHWSRSVYPNNGTSAQWTTWYNAANSYSWNHTQPNMPSSLMAAYGDSGWERDFSINVSWIGNSAESSYDQINQYGTAWRNNELTYSGGTWYFTLLDGTTLRYWRRGVRVYYQKYIPPPRPAWVTYSNPQPVNSHVAVSWESVSTADSYRVQVRRRDASTGAWTGYETLAAATTATSYTYNSANLNGYDRIQFRVRASNIAGNSSYRTGGEAPIVYPPSVTTLPPTNIGSASAIIRGEVLGTGGANPARYLQYGSTTAYGGQPSGTHGAGGGGVGTYSFLYTGLAPNTLYYYRAYAANPAGTAYAARVSFRTLAAVPSLSLHALSSGRIDIAIDTNNNPAGTEYQIERSLDGTAGWTLVRTWSASLSYSDTGLLTNTRYYYRVRARNAAGLTTNWAGDHAWTLANVPTLSLNSVSAHRIDISIGANGNPGGTEYQIERSPDGSHWSVLRTWHGLTVYSDQEVSAGTRYYYRVQARNTAGTETAFAQDDIYSRPAQPGSISYHSQVGAGGSIAVSWEPVTGAGTYRLQRRYQRADGTYTSYSTVYTGTGTSNTISISSSTADEGVQFRVRAENSGGVGTYRTGSWSTILHVPNTPEAFTAPTGSYLVGGSVHLNWGDTLYWGNPLGTRDYRVQASFHGSAYSTIATTGTTSSFIYGLLNHMNGSTVRFRVRAESGGGYSGWRYSDTFLVDTKPPAIEASPENRGWDKTDVSVNLSMRDDESGLFRQRYAFSDSSSLPGTGWSGWSTSGSRTVSTSANGVWYLHVQAEDHAGNMANVCFGPYKINKVTLDEIVIDDVLFGSGVLDHIPIYAKAGSVVFFHTRYAGSVENTWAYVGADIVGLEIEENERYKGKFRVPIDAEEGTVFEITVHAEDPYGHAFSFHEPEFVIVVGSIWEDVRLRFIR